MAKRGGRFPGMDIPEYYNLIKELFSPEESAVFNAIPKGYHPTDTIAASLDRNEQEGPIDDNRLRKYFLEEVKSSEEELKWNLAEIYSKYFTEDELKAILRFFDSPVGRSWRDNDSMIQPEIDQVGHEWGQILTQRILKKFETTYGEKF